MKRGRILVLGIAFAAAIGAALIARNMVSGPEVRTVEKVVGAKQVLVASHAIELGGIADAAAMKWQEWPEAGVTPQMITKEADPKAMEELAGSIARAPFISGEPIARDKLVKSGEGGVLAAILPSGKRAVSISIDPESAVSGFILPDDRVDVVLTHSIDSGRDKQQVSETILRNVRVLAVGQALESPDGEKVASGSTATLELMPSQVETMALAHAMGPISLSLRSLEDTPRKGEPTAEIGHEQGTSIKILKYAQPSRAFGVD